MVEAPLFSSSMRGECRSTQDTPPMFALPDVVSRCSVVGDALLNGPSSLTRH